MKLYLVFKCALECDELDSLWIDFYRATVRKKYLTEFEIEGDEFVDIEKWVVDEVPGFR